MAQPTHFFVRAVNGSDTPGQGTSHVTAYRTIQFAIDDVIASHGNPANHQFNLCSEDPFLLSTTIDAGSLNNSDILLSTFSGYDAVENDLGLFDLDCQGNSIRIIDNDPNLVFKDGRAHNNGNTQRLFNFGNDCQHVRMQCYDCGVAFYGSQRGQIHHSGYWNVNGNQAVYSTFGNMRIANSFLDVRNAGSQSLRLQADALFCHNIVLTGAGNEGIGVTSAFGIFNNSFLGDGAGAIFPRLQTAGKLGVVHSNIFEGYSLDTTVSLTGRHLVYANNSYFNVPTRNYIDSVDVKENELLAASGYAKSGDPTYANRFAYFAPTAEGNVRKGAYGGDPNCSRGAVQYEGDGGGAGSTVIIEG